MTMIFKTINEVNTITKTKIFNVFEHTVIKNKWLIVLINFNCFL